MFVTAYNFSNLPSELIQEKVSDEVLVEPSESFTVRELIYRLAMGMPVSSGVRSGDYPDHDQDFDDVLPTEDPDFDLADYATLKNDLADRERQRKSDMEKAYKEKLEKEKETRNPPQKRLQTAFSVQRSFLTAFVRFSFSFAFVFVIFYHRNAKCVNAFCKIPV